jgi:UDP-N-acetylmuramoyl-L-alanyl-D-glutamate--2,6-diaminopimelate ligase
VEKFLRLAKKLLPKKVFSLLQPIYHYKLAFLSALIYRFPSRKIKVVAVTGTKGKSSVVELTNAILEAAGFKTAVLGTIRFKVGEESQPNLYKMTTPGRFFVQKFLRRAVNARCDYAVLEMTSEAARQFRHKFIAFDALIFTNISPEHIESHGSYEKYVAAKISIGEALSKSPKENRVLVVNTDDKEAAKFIALKIPTIIPYSLQSAESYELRSGNISFTFDGKTINPKLEGVFNVMNCLAAATFAKSQGITTDIIKRGLENVKLIPGRVEHVTLKNPDDVSGKQNFTVIVDYAHTPDSLRALYEAFQNKTKICVLGNTGGGRDTWKRPEMGKIADDYCDKIILTNEDPYDEAPETIVRAMAAGMKKHQPEIIMDRREAIAAALRAAAKMSSLNPASPAAGEAGSGAGYQNTVVLITGKGTDPYIMGPHDSKLVWDDKTVAREELEKILKA